MDYPQVYIAYSNDNQWDMIAFESREECREFCMTHENLTWTSIPYKKTDEAGDKEAKKLKLR